MTKKEIAIDTIFYPMPCSLVGANVNGKANYLTVAWFTMVGSKPPYMAIALGKNHYTNGGIRENGTFSVNIPSAGIVELTDFRGIVSGRKFDKAEMFDTFYGSLETAPMIRECPYNLECRLIQTVDLVADELFIGEIVAAYSEDRFLTNGVPDIKKMNPMVLSMPENLYLAVGEPIGRAWEAGTILIKK